MNFDDYNPERRFRSAWQAVDVVRSVPYSLFTFGESQLPVLSHRRFSNTPANRSTSRRER